MTTAAWARRRANEPRKASAESREPRPRTFNVDEYYRMAEVGILRADERLELIDGAIVSMSPIGSGHAARVATLGEWFNLRVKSSASVRVQSPIRLSEQSEPEPDVALVRRRADHYANAHPAPEDTLLVVEVSDMALAFDRGPKLSLFAAAGIPEVWIVNLVDEQVEVYRGPEPSGYAEMQTFAKTATVSPLAVPALRLRLRNLFV